MTIAAVIVLCVVLFVLALLLPLLSRGPQRGVGTMPSAGARAGGGAPGPAGRLLLEAVQQLAQGHRHERRRRPRPAREAPPLAQERL